MKPAPIAVANTKRLNNLVRRLRYMGILKIIESRFFSAGYLSPAGVSRSAPLAPTRRYSRPFPFHPGDYRSHSRERFFSSPWLNFFFRRARRFSSSCLSFCVPAPRRRSIPLSTYPVCVFFQSELPTEAAAFSA